MIRFNTVDSIIRRVDGTSGTTVGIYTSSGSTQIIKNNTINNIKISLGASTGGIIYGIQSATGTVVIDSNIVSNLNNTKSTSTAVMYGIYNVASPTNENYNYNIVYNLTNTGTGNTFGMFFNTTTGTRNVSYNRIYNISSNATAVDGIRSTTSSPSIFNNRIYNITTTSLTGLVSGISVTTIGSGAANIYNNLISELNAPAVSSSSDAVRGINITATSSTTQVNITNNSIYLTSTSSGANFSTSGIFATTSTTATSAELRLRNNIVVNLSTPKGTGVVSAYRRSSSTLTNFSNLSNNNVYYAGTPSINKVIFTDGANFDSTLTQYKARVSSRDQASISLLPNFTSTVSTDANFLNINTGIATQLESGGLIVAPVTFDVAGNVRAGNPGYPAQTNGGGTSPDIGAWEFDGIAAAPTVSFVSLTPPAEQCVAVAHTVTLNIIANIGTVDSAKLSYAYDGTPAGTILMTNTTGTTYTAVIPTAVPSTATVSWTATAWNSAGLNKSLTGTSYKDEPLSNLGLGIASSAMPLCIGDSATLSTTLPPAAPLGNGGTTNGNSGQSPFTQGWEGQRTQYIISAQLMQARGYVAGPLTSLSVNVTSGTNTYPFENYTVKMANTTTANLATALDNTPTTTVFGPATVPVVTAVPTLKTVTFSTPFVWDGTSNILIDICYDNDPLGTLGTRWSTTSTVQATTTSYTSVRGYYADNTLMCGTTNGTLTTSSSLPAFIFGAAPKAFSSYNWTVNGVSVGNTASIKVSPNDTTDYILTVVDATTGCSASDTITLNVSNTQLGGTYTVGNGGNFPTLTAAINAFNEVCTISSPVVFELTDTAYRANETFPIIISHNPKRTAVNNLTIRPASGASPIIYGTVASNAIIQLRGADNVIINGSNNNTTSRDLTIRNLSGTGVAVWIASSTQKGSNNNTIQNVNISGSTPTSTIAGIISGGIGSLGGEAEFSNNNNRIHNNRITSVQNALYLRGKSTSKDLNWVIDSNVFGDTASLSRLGFRGMLIGDASNFLISKNTISGVYSSTASTSAMTGIQIAFAVDSGLITRNKVSAVYQNNTTGYGAYGILLAQSSNTAKLRVSNNFVWNLRSSGSATVANNSHGIVVNTGGGYGILNNTVSMTTEQVLASGVSSALLINGATTDNSLDIRNNIFNQGAAVGNTYAIYSTVGDSVFAHFDNNGLNSVGANLANIRGTNQADIVALRASMPGFNLNSVEETPVFTSANDLHIPAATLTYFESKGQTIPGLTVDIDGDQRPGPAGSSFGGATAYDIGADEFDGTPNLGDIITPTITIDSIVPPLNACNVVAHKIYAKIIDASGIDSAQIRYSVAGVTMTPIDMVDLGGDTSFLGTIPATLPGELVSFRIWAKDASVNGNVITTAASTYKDALLNVNAGPDVEINEGKTATLIVQRDATFKISEFNLFNYTGGSGPTGNGSNATWPVNLPTTMYDDNVEITNVGTTPADLSGYKILIETSATATPVNFTFPVGTIVPANSVVVVNMAGAGSTSIPNLVFAVTGGTYAPGSGSSFGIILKAPDNSIVDAVATNTYVFSATNGVSSSDWTGPGVTSPSGIAGATLQGIDANTRANWVTGSPATPVSIGFINPNIQVIPSNPVTWTGGLLTNPYVGDTLVTPVHPTAGVFNYIATISDSTCSFSDTVVVTVNVPVTPLAAFTPSNDSALVGSNPSIITLTDNSLNVPDAWKWTITPNTYTFVNQTTATSRNPEVIFTAPGFYDIKLVASNSAGSDSITLSQSVLGVLNYCVSAATGTTGIDIGNVKISSQGIPILDNGIATPVVSNTGSTGTYSDFTASIPAPVMHFGVPYVFELSPINSATSTTTTLGRSVYIDFNQNGLFTDAGELVFTSNAFRQVVLKDSVNIFIPRNAKVGTTRMRVVANTSNAIPLSCGTYTNGETEDYLVNIIVPPGDFYPPDFGTTISVVPPGGDCQPIAHVISINITDSTGVDSAWINYSVDGIQQPRVLMSPLGSLYSGTLPAVPAGSLVEYSFIAKDNSPQANIGTANGGSYVDAFFNVDALSDVDSAGLGVVFQLNAKTPPLIAEAGDGTNQSLLATTPFYGVWGGNKKQYLYTAAELQAAGLPTGIINSIAFDVHTGSMDTYNAFTVYIDSTRQTNLTAGYLPSGNTVFGPTNYTSVLGKNTFNFANNFVWNGLSNVYVTICWSNENTGGIGTSYVVSNTAPENRTRYSHIDSQTPAAVCSNTGGTAVTTRADIDFGYPMVVTYAWTQSNPQAGISATNIANPTATPTALGTYTYTVSANNGTCTYVDSVTIKVINIIPPVAKFGVNTEVGLATTSVFTFSDSSLNLPTAWNWSFTPNTVTFVNNTSGSSRNPQVTFDAAGNYSVELIASNNAGSDTLLKPLYVEILNAYCPSGTQSSSGDSDIGRFRVNGFFHGDSLPLNNNTAANGTYTDLTSLTGLVIQKAVPANVVMTATTSGGTYYAGLMNVFVDYNQNGVFDLPAERVFGGSVSNVVTQRVVTGSFVPPTSALSGKTLMRVILDEGGSGVVDPCLLTYGWGETEDYIVTILNPPPGDYYPPVISNIVNAQTDSSCTVTPHTISVTAFDTTGVDSVWLNWRIGTTGPINTITMTSAGAGVYTATIPANGTQVVTYTITAQDNSVNQNIATYPGGSYRDDELNTKITKTADGFIGVGGNYPLNATVTNLISLGTGTTQGNSGLTPFTQGWEGQRTQYLISSQILTNAGYKPGPMNSISINVTSGTQTYPFEAYTIRMAQVSLTGLVQGTFESIPMTTVYGPTQVAANTSSGLRTFNFASPFVWNGTSNILVEICFENDPLASLGTRWSSNSTVEALTTSYTSVIGTYSDNNPMCGTSNGTATSSTALPAFRFAQPITVSYNWTQPTGGGLSSTTIANPVASPTAGLGTYQYIVAVNDGRCTSYDTVVVNVIPPPVVDLGPDSSVICGTTPRLLDAGNLGSTYTWYRNNVQFATTRTVNATLPGMYRVVVRNQANLTSSDSIKLNAAPAFTISLTDVTLCDGGSLVLDPGAYSAYLWATGETTRNITVTAAGEYIVTVFNAEGCSATDTINVTIVPPPTLDLGADQSICSSSPLTLNTGIADATFVWSTGATTPSITVSTSGQYSVIVTTNTGCVLMDTINITNLPSPVVNLGADQDVCSGTAVTLNAGNAGATYLWSTGATTQTVNVTAAGTYWVDVTSTNGCTTRDSVVITNRPTPVVNLGVDRDICTSDTITLDAGNVGSTYLWSTGATTQTIRVSLAGNYSVVVTNPQGCSSNDEVIVTNKAIPNSDYTSQAVSADRGQQIQFTANVSAGNQYLWNFGDPASGSNNTSLTPTPLHVFTSPGNFTVTLTVTNVATGCVSVTSKTILVSSIGTDMAEVFDMYAAPNPFVGNTKINYTLPSDASNVSVEIYDLLGRSVGTIVNNARQVKGKYEYQFENSDTELTSGVYFVKLIVDGNVGVIRVIDLARKQ